MPDKIKTTDMYLCAALMISGGKFSISESDARNPKSIVFCISGEGLEQKQTAWLNRELTGNLYEYANLIRDMKVMVHDVANGK